MLLAELKMAVVQYEINRKYVPISQTTHRQGTADPTMPQFYNCISCASVQMPQSPSYSVILGGPQLDRYVNQ